MAALPVIGAVADRAEAQESMPSPARLPSLASTIARQANLEGRVLWMDGTANLSRLSTREGVSEIMEKARLAGVNTVVVDVKPLSGHVLYNSKIAPKLTEWRGFTYPADFDLLQVSIMEGRRRGLRVYASFNVFSEGHKLVKSGPLYSKPELQATVYDVQRRVTAADGESHLLTIGENRPVAGDGDFCSFDSNYNGTPKISPDDAAAVIIGDKVHAIVDGGLTDGAGIPVPDGGHILIGRGVTAQWLLQHLKVGDTLVYAATEVLQPILDAPSEAVGGFVNPAAPESRKYALSIVEEIANTYPVDGVVFDRMRFSSLRSDFSPLSRAMFEERLGKKLERFPHDIYSHDPIPGRPLIRGQYFKEWLEWRATVITSWLDEAKQVVQRVRPTANLGVYVGSWYADYYDVGVNWGASDYAPGLDWMTPSYPATGYAAKLNWVSTGCYYGIANRQDARQLGQPEEETVEAAAQTSIEAVNDASFVYAGLQLLDYRGRPDEFRKALQTALASTQGVMLFDLVYLEEYNWWNILSEVFSTPKRAPHDVPGLLEAVQQAKKALAVAAPPRPSQ